MWMSTISFERYCQWPYQVATEGLIAFWQNYQNPNSTTKQPQPQRLRMSLFLRSLIFVVMLAGANTTMGGELPQKSIGALQCSLAKLYKDGGHPHRFCGNDSIPSYSTGIVQSSIKPYIKGVTHFQEVGWWRTWMVECVTLFLTIQSNITLF